jgi:NMD protein affecting ribosome stability and mRNA decay
MKCPCCGKEIEEYGLCNACDKDLEEYIKKKEEIILKQISLPFS